MKKYSIILPTYNNEKYIRECINSFLSQTFDDFELIVSNNLSTDKTQDILVSFSDKRLKIIHPDQHMDFMDHWNFAVSHANGEWIYTLGADDAVLPLGHYDKAYKLMCYPTQNLTHVITPVLHPILSEHQNDKQYIYEKYLQIIKILSLCGIFIMVFCFFASDEIIRLLFGEKWIPAVPCFKFMSISIWAQIITSSSGSIFQSLGNSKMLFISGTLNAVLTVISIILGLIEGNINAVARNVGIIYNFHFISTYIILIHFVFKMSYLKFMYFLLPDLFMIAIMYCFGFFIENVCLKIQVQNVFCIFGIKFITFFVCYVILIALFGQIKYLKNIGRNVK